MNPSVIYSNSYDVFDQWNRLVTDIYSDTLVSKRFVKIQEFY